MLFDIAPKERREDLYDRENELRSLMEALRLGERLVIVRGVRRIGKSSLVRVGVREAGIPYALVDVRELYFEEGSVRLASLVARIVDAMRRRSKWYERLEFRLGDALGKVKGIHAAGFSLELRPPAKPRLTEVLKALDEWCGEHGWRFALVFDEAQYLRFSNTRYDGVIAWAIDNLPNLTFIVTGSEVGVLREFLRLEDPRAPLYGRHRREIPLERFTTQQSLGFLETGFRELGVRVKRSELEEAVEKLDGIVGWLTLYGYKRGVEGSPHREALRRVFEEGSLMVLAELSKVIEGSPARYVAILKAVAQGITRWREIKTYVETRTNTWIPDNRFSQLLRNLVRYSYLEKQDNEYVIPDPMVRHAAKSL
ncbi:MAG: ATP-binding protein [Desulfurococcales archaeon]|nr:ATP-binding protein [Desulfurococcales archaeon]